MSAARDSICPLCGTPGSSGDRLQVCSACRGISLHPLPDAATLRQVSQAHQQRLQQLPESFDWRLFLLDLHLRGRGTVTTLGARDPSFDGAAASRGYEPRHAESAPGLPGGSETHRIDPSQPDPAGRQPHHAAVDVQQAGQGAPSAPTAMALWDLLDHDPHPLETLRAAATAAGEGGLLLVRVRDRGARASRLKVPRHVDWGHAHYFEQRTLRALFVAATGEEPLIVQCQTGGADFLVAALRLGAGARAPRRRALLISHPDAFGNIDDAPGPRMRIAKTLLGLHRRGWGADLAVCPHPVAADHDLVHLYHHAWRSHDGLEQAGAALEAGLPLLVSTIYMELSESTFAVEAIPRIFQCWSPAEREALLARLERGELTIKGSDAPGRIPVARPVVEAQRTLFSLADRLIGLSLTEMRAISQRLGVHRPFSIVPNCADVSLFREGSAARFSERWGVRDFVISVGHLEPRKNQLMLLYALRDAGLPLVVVGAANEITEDYAALCRYYAPPGTVFISQMPQHELADAFAAARVHALPSWNEGASLASIEAAMSGCAIVVGDRAGEWEYYGEAAHYCDPASIGSIRDAVRGAYAAGRGASTELARRFTERNSFEAHVAATLEAYEATLAGLAAPTVPLASGSCAGRAVAQPVAAGGTAG